MQLLRPFGHLILERKYNKIPGMPTKKELLTLSLLYFSTLDSNKVSFLKYPKFHYNIFYIMIQMELPSYNIAAFDFTFRKFNIIFDFHWNVGIMSKRQLNLM